jgi:hypothetical protein
VCEPTVVSAGIETLTLLNEPLESVGGEAG